MELEKRERNRDLGAHCCLKGATTMPLADLPESLVSLELNE
jgi:hypothetical protein